MQTHILEYINLALPVSLTEESLSKNGRIRTPINYSSIKALRTVANILKINFLYNSES